MDKKRIYLKAYFRKNLGDDMFVRCISERYPNVSFKIYTSPEYAEPFSNQTNINNVSYLKYLFDKIANKLFGKSIFKQQIEKKSEATVHIGGSIFIEPDNFVPLENYYSTSKIFYVGCNFGPYKRKSYHDFISFRLKKAQDVCFRDSYSFNEFKELRNVRMEPDVLFGYKNYPTPKKGCGIGISVIGFKGRKNLEFIAKTYYDVIAQMIDLCVNEGIPIKLFSFCKDEGDNEAISEIISRCKIKEVEVCEYSGDIDEILEKINDCEYVIASRFHAMIIGWCLSKKVLPVIYSDKQTNVIDDAGYLGAKWDLRKEVYTADKLFKDTITSNSFDVERFVEKAGNQFEKLDLYININ